MTKEDALNFIIAEEVKDGKLDTNKIRDGYHSFGELYEHRITLFILFCKMLYIYTNQFAVWKSKFHSDGSDMLGWFIMGIETEPGKQITYHLPNEKWELCFFAKTLLRAPEWDGHTSNDVLDRLKLLDITVPYKMGKSSEEFMREREFNAKKYPYTPDQAFEGKPCPDCEGLGEHAESYCCGGSIIEGICFTCKQSTQPTKCLTCKGTGIVDYTEDDAVNDK